MVKRAKNYIQNLARTFMKNPSSSSSFSSSIHQSSNEYGAGCLLSNLLILQMLLFVLKLFYIPSMYLPPKHRAFTGTTGHGKLLSSCLYQTAHIRNYVALAVAASVCFCPALPKGCYFAVQDLKASD